MGAPAHKPPDNPHLGQPVETWGAALPAARGVVVALHGREQQPADIRAVCERIGGDDLAFIAPAAAHRSWYPHPFAAPLDDNEPGLTQSLQRVDLLVRDLLGRGVAARHIVLLGFSQGACLAAEYALRHPRHYGALVVFTGSAIGPADTRWPHHGSLGGTPVLVGGCRHDAWVPWTRMQATAALLRERGAQVVEHYYDGDTHAVSAEEVDAARRLIAGVR